MKAKPAKRAQSRTTTRRTATVGKYLLPTSTHSAQATTVASANAGSQSTDKLSVSTRRARSDTSSWHAANDTTNRACAPVECVAGAESFLHPDENGSIKLSDYVREMIQLYVRF